MLCDENLTIFTKWFENDYEKWIVSSIFFCSHGSILQNLESQSLFGYNKNFLFQTTWISTIGILDGSMMVRAARIWFLPSA